MEGTDAGSHLLDRLGQSVAAQAVPAGPWLVTALAAAAVIVAVPPLWRVLRPLVTVVHELGHAVVGLLCGRRFTGFAVSPDMSGHTVTAGRPRGAGLVLTTLAGYPMPALVGAAMIAAAMAGRADPVLLAALVLLLTALARSRSLFTVAVLAAGLVGVGALWWTGDVAATSTVVAGAGMVLLVGAWRQFGAVVAGGGRADDPAALARITRAPAWAWKLLMAVLIAVPTGWAVRALLPVVRLALASP